MDGNHESILVGLCIEDAAIDCQTEKVKRWIWWLVIMI